MKAPWEFKEIELFPAEGKYTFRGFKLVSESREIYLGSFACYDQEGFQADGRERAIYESLQSLFPEKLKFFSLKQVHSDRIHEAPEDSDQVFSQFETGDGLFTDRPREVLTIRTADCLPLFIVQGSRISILHVGYKGLAEGILDRFFERALLKNKEKVLFSIGNHIKPCCLEIREDVISLFDSYAYLRPNDIIQREESHYLNLSSMVKNWIESKLGSDCEILDESSCTCCTRGLFSYRRNKTPYRTGHCIFRLS